MSVVLTAVTRVVSKIPAGAIYEAYAAEDTDAIAKLRQQLDGVEVVKTTAIQARVDMTPLHEPLEAYGDDDKSAMVNLFAKVRSVLEAQHAQIVELKRALEEAKSNTAVAASASSSSTSTPVQSGSDATTANHPPFTWSELESVLNLAFSPTTKKTLTYGEIYYVVPWLWLNYCRTTRGHCVGSVDTESAVETAVGSGFASRTGIVKLRHGRQAMAEHNCFIPEAGWGKLASWFGVRGPAIPRVVRWGSLCLETIDVVVCVLHYVANTLNGHSIHARRLAELPYFANETAMVLESDVATMLGVSATSFRLWNVTDASSYSLLQYGAYSTFADLQLADGKTVVAVEPMHPSSLVFNALTTDVQKALATLQKA